MANDINTKKLNERKSGTEIKCVRERERERALERGRDRDWQSKRAKELKIKCK